MHERSGRLLPEVNGIITRAEIAQTIDAIAAVQARDGNIPWVPGGHTDPWNLVEAAMALDVGHRFVEAERAYEWLAHRQHERGSWHAYYVGDDVKEHTLDTNVTCYVANGVWHHYLSTRDNGFLEAMFPMVERAIDFALDHQHPTGEIEWDADPFRTEGKGALLTGSSSIYSSLRCAIAAAEQLGRERPDWELSLGSLAIAIAHRPERFLDKERWAMDWYYPILAGVLRGRAAHARVAARWETFVAEGRGVRCVSDQPWITAAETCELVLALDAIGLDERARTLFAWVQFLRHDDGSYWTGMNFADDRFGAWGEYFTAEQPTWNSAAVVLAANALGGSGPTAGLFRGEGLPAGLTADELIAAGAAIEAERATRAHQRFED
ncbi:MAG TPA: prenyltransferase [Acidimicrobiia bacterium]|nr:prenyltransferase [Acidimicrobiia bacterium]